MGRIVAARRSAARNARAWSTALALAGAFALVAHAPAHAATYKWVDEKGVVHYTDKPPETQKGGVVLDKQGRPMQRIEPAPTPEQIRAREAELERQQAVARQQETLERRDRALMNSYTTETEIDLARSRSLGTLENQIQSAQAYLTQLAKRKKELDARKAAVGKALPLAQERELESIETEIAKNTELVAQKQKEVTVVTARYDADKQRWRELKAIADANKDALKPGGRSSVGAVAGQEK